MKFSHLFVLLSCLLLFSCSKQLQLTKSEVVYTNINNSLKNAPSIESIVEPYRNKLEHKMNVAIGATAVELIKEQPESTLGNFTADAILYSSRQHSTDTVHAAITNYGGLRIPSISKGDITLGRIYELMPFDNMLVVLEMKGNQINSWIKHFVNLGGWPVSKEFNITYDTLTNNINIKLNNQPIEENKTYRICTSDYIANGGDNCDFLKSIPREDLGIFFRNGIIEYVENKQKNNEKINSKIEGRITFK